MAGLSGPVSEADLHQRPVGGRHLDSVQLPARDMQNADRRVWQERLDQAAGAVVPGGKTGVTCPVAPQREQLGAMQELRAVDRQVECQLVGQKGARPSAKP